MSVHNWLFNLLLIPRWLIVLFFIYYYWNKFPEIKGVIERKFDFSSELLRYTFIKIALIVVIYQLFIIITFNNYFYLNGTHLIWLILNTSKYLIQFLGYNCLISNRIIYGDNASLYMDDACLGIDLMFLFASFIVVIPGKIKHKIWFIPLGILIILLLNCLRVVLIFVNLSKNRSYSLPLEIHDLFTYPVLIFTLLLWIIWINKFLIKKKVIAKKELDIQKNTE
jgi:exosortase/archaeosortase family protein